MSESVSLKLEIVSPDGGSRWKRQAGGRAVLFKEIDGGQVRNNNYDRDNDLCTHDVLRGVVTDIM